MHLGGFGARIYMAMLFFRGFWKGGEGKHFVVAWLFHLGVKLGVSGGFSQFVYEKI